MFKANLNKIILCATAKNLVAGFWHGDQLQQNAVFNHDAFGKQAFATWLNHYAALPIYFIANAVEEDYRLESLPHSAGKEKRELIERKLNQFYRGLVFRTAHFIGREKDKRKDDKFLFVALNNDDFLQDWLVVIQQADAPLVGIYLLPMLSQTLCQSLSQTKNLSTTHILLCERLSSGLRQTYLHNGQLRMSRLIPNLPIDENQLGYFYLVETQKTRLYLMSKRFISRDITLNLQLVSIHDDMQAIQQSFSQEPGIACETFNLRAISKKINLHPQALEAMPELLHMQFLANGQQIDNLAPAMLTKTFQLSKFSQRIKKATLLLGLCGLIVTAYYVIAGLEQQSNVESAQQATEITQQRYRDAASHFPKTPLKAQDLKTAVLLRQQISLYPASPLRLMHVVSRALELSPNIALNRLRWLQTNDLALKDADDLKGLAANSTAIVNANNAMNMGVAATTQRSTFALAELAFISAEIIDFNGDYRDAGQKVQRFAEYLKKDADVAQVEILQTPVNMRSYTDLQGSTANTQNQPLSPALFKIKLLLKPHSADGAPSP